MSYSETGSGWLWSPQPHVIRAALVQVGSWGLGTAMSWAATPEKRAALAIALTILAEPWWPGSGGA